MEEQTFTQDGSVWIADDQITGVWSFIASIDWTEPWLVALVITHALLMALALVARRRTWLQCALFAVALGASAASERLNALGARHWRSFSRQQYFDSGGLFMVLVVCAPLMAVALIVLVSWVIESGQLLIKVKRTELLRAAKKNKK